MTVHNAEVLTTAMTAKRSALRPLLQLSTPSIVFILRFCLEYVDLYGARLWIFDQETSLARLFAAMEAFLEIGRCGRLCCITSMRHVQQQHVNGAVQLHSDRIDEGRQGTRHLLRQKWEELEHD